MIDMNKEQVSTKSSSNYALPCQPNRTLPLRPPPPASVRNRSILKFSANNADKTIKRDNLLESDVYEITYHNNNDDAEFVESENHLEKTNFHSVDDVQCLNMSRGDSKNTEMRKRKLETSINETREKNCKKQFKHDVKGSASKVQELNECSVKLKDVMCMKRSEISSGKNDSVEVTKRNEESIKLVPPLRLKKVIQEITVNQQKSVTENKNLTSEVEISDVNYKVISETAPDSESSSQVSTTLTSNTTSIVPKSFIDNVRITIPSLPELGICKSYEITGPNFVATMTSEIENAGTQSTKMWPNCAIQESPILHSRKLKGKINESIESHSIRIFNEDMSEERSVPDYTITSTNKLTPIISLAKSFGTLDNCSNNFSLSFLTKDNEIKLEQIFEESFEIPESDSFNASSQDEMNDFSVNDIPANKTQEQIIVHFDNLHSNDENVLCKDKDDSNNNEKDLSYDGKMLKYRQTNLEKKLNELKNKTIELQEKVNSQNKIILEQTMSQYEKHIENLSQLLKKLSSEEFDSTLEEENKQIEKTQSFDEEKKFRDSMSASPPKLLPNSQDGYENTDPLREIRNSPPVLRRVFFPSMIKCKSPSMINSNKLSCEQSDKPTENITNCSNLMIDPIYIKNETNDELLSSRRMIEIHDDECVEVTLLMKPMSNDETKDIKIVENKIENENSNTFIENLLMLKEQNSTDDENSDNQVQSIMDKDKSDTMPLVIIEDISLDNQGPIANNLDNFLEMPSDFEKTKNISSNDNKISDNLTQTNIFSSHDSVDYDSARTFNNNSFKNPEVPLNPTVVKPPPKVRSKKCTSKKLGQAKFTISTQMGHTDDRNMTNPTPTNPNLLQTTLSTSCLHDNNYHTQFNSLSNSSCLSKIYTAPSMHSGGNYSLTNVTNYQREGNGNINEDNLQMVSKNIITEPVVLASHRSRAVNQCKSTVTQNPQTQIIKKSNPIDNNGMMEQFPSFGNWAANITQRESSRNKKKVNVEPKTNVYGGTAMKNVEVTRSNYMIGNVAYIPRWNAERPLDRPQPIITESHPSYSNILSPRQRFLPTAPIPRILSGHYTIDPYAPVFGCNTAYPFGSNLSYAPFQSVSAQPATMPHPDKRLPNSPVFRNGADFVKIANSLPGPIVEKHPVNLGAEYVRSTAHNNYSILMESQSARPLYKELNVSHHDETNLEQSSNQRKHAYEAYIQRMLREQQIIAASKTMRPRNEPLQAINHEIITNPLTTNVLTASTNSSAIYTANSSQMQQMKTSDSMNRSCPTPNIGKMIKNVNLPNMRCFNCGTPNAVFQCLGCETASYCNEICQAQHWNEHVLKCPKMMPKLKKVL